MRDRRFLSPVSRFSTAAARGATAMLAALALAGCNAAASSGDDGLPDAGDATGAFDVAVDATDGRSDARPPDDVPVGTHDIAPLDVAVADVPPDQVDHDDPGDVGHDVPAACDRSSDCALGQVCIPVDPRRGGECLDRCVAGATSPQCPTGYDCRALPVGADLEAVCVPVRDNACAACASDLDCLNARCVDLEEGPRCAVRCDAEGLCADGFVCGAVGGTPLCLPESGSCAAPCIDRDGDGYGEGLLCLGRDCDDARADTHPGAAEFCDLVDNDCDGAVDEGFDLATDERHCGGCGRICAIDDGAVGAPACHGGICSVVCPEGFRDCDGDPANGCEAAVNACGGCATLPADAAPGLACGACGATWACLGESAIVCEGGTTPNACGGCGALDGRIGDPCPCGALACDGADTLTCVETRPRNACGGCAELAARPGASCTVGACGVGEVVCNGTDATTCVGEDAPTNACGGCATLANAPGTICGPCALNRYVCGGPNQTVCDGATTNECGGCGSLAYPVGAPCGVDGRGDYRCGGGDVYCHDAIALVLDGRDVQVKLNAYHLWGGRTLGEALASRALCAVFFDGMSDPYQIRIERTVDKGVHGLWAAFTLPPLLPGWAPYPTCSACMSAPGAAQGLPMRFSFIAGPLTTGPRCAAVDLRDAVWSATGVPADGRAPGAIYSGIDNMCSRAWNFAVSQVDGRVVFSGERFATWDDTTCPRAVP